MALGNIATTLRELGIEVTAKWPKAINPGVPEKPRMAKMFPMLMMMGWMLLIIGVIWAFALNGTVLSYWTHSIATELNPAQTGSALLSQLGVIKGALPWLNFLRFAGMGALLLGITIALTVIIRTLQFQEGMLNDYVKFRMAGGGD